MIIRIKLAAPRRAHNRLINIAPASFVVLIFDKNNSAPRTPPALAAADYYWLRCGAARFNVCEARIGLHSFIQVWTRLPERPHSPSDRGVPQIELESTPFRQRADL